MTLLFCVKYLFGLSLNHNFTYFKDRIDYHTYGKEKDSWTNSINEEISYIIERFPISFSNV